MNPLRICMAIDYYHPVVGGSEIQAQRLSERLFSMGLKIDVVTRRCPDVSDTDSHGGVVVHRLPVFGRERTASVMFVAGLFPFLLRRRHAFDVIHCHLATSTAIACLSTGMLTATPVVVKLGGSGRIGDIAASLATRLGRMKLYVLRKGPCSFIAPTRQIAQELIKIGVRSGRINIIPNGVDTQHLFPQEREEKRAAKCARDFEGLNLALCLGRLDPHKNIPLLIDAWSKVREHNRDWRLWIIGSGPLEGVIKNLIHKRDMGQSITLMSRVSPERVKEYLNLADLLVHPSRFEGLSNAVLEGMACGLPIIASRIPGNLALVTDHVNGLLFDPGDADDCARCLEAAFANEKERFRWGANGRRWVVEHMDLGMVARMHIDLYCRLLEGSENTR
ncbi:MAG: glycosyltransferase family 4 protein [bacterium]